MAKLTQARLKELVSYDEKTGIFRRLVYLASKTRAKDPMGSVDSHGYLWASVDGKVHRLHRLAILYMTGKMPPSSIDIDHVDMNRANNAYANLRVVDRATNMQNKRAASANNKTGFLGVFLHKKLKKYTAQIRFGGKNRHLGLFETPELAHEAYLKAKRKFHEGNTL